VAKDTQDILVSACQLLEETMYRGSEADNPLSFNGLISQIPANTATYQNSVVHDLTEPDAERLSTFIPKFIAKISGRRNPAVRVTHCKTSAAGAIWIQTEWSEARINLSEVENVLGGRTLGIYGANGIIPIDSTPFIFDRSPAGANYDEVDYWFIDDEQWIWQGVYPYMGAQTFEPQLMDVSSMGPNGQPLTDKRLLIMYGTPYAKNRGAAIHRLTVRLPRGSAWNIQQ
jgi:hypothetical protein